MSFDPLEEATHYPETFPKHQFDILKTQEFHSKQNSLPKEMQTELDKIQQCELLLFHFQSGVLALQTH